jgi:hypothetical protein
MFTWLPVCLLYVSFGCWRIGEIEVVRVPSMKVFTHRPSHLPGSISTGKDLGGIADRRDVLRLPETLRVAAYQPQLRGQSRCRDRPPLARAKAQRISNGAPGTARICSGCMVFKFHITMVLLKCFMASGSFTTSPRSRM